MMPKAASLLLQLHAAAALWSKTDWRTMFRTASECPRRTHVKVIHGAIPAALRGTAYKVGPGRFGVGSEEYAHWLDGDGYVFARTADGGASYRARFVETAGYATSRKDHLAHYIWNSAIRRSPRERL